MAESQPVPMDMAIEKYTEEDAVSVGLPSPGAMNLLRIFAKQMAGTPFFPKGLGEHPGTVMAVVLTGREMGLDPMQSLRSFWLSPDGRLGMYADAMLALMRKHGFKFEWITATNECCECKATRPDGETYTSRFDLEDARRAGLLEKERSAWRKYPRNMCRWRVIADIFRTLASDLGGSQMYDKEELLDMEDDRRPTNPADTAARTFQQASRFTVGRKEPPPPETVESTPQTASIKPEPEAAVPETASAEPETEAPETVSRSGHEEPAPEPEPKPEPQLPTSATVSMSDRWKDAIVTLGGDQEAQNILKRYFRKWFDTGKLPMDLSLYEEAMKDLESRLATDRDSLLNNAGQAGAEDGKKRRSDDLFSHFAWSDATKLAAKDLIALRGYTPEQFLKFSEVIGLPKLADADALAFLSLSKYTRSAGRLMDIGEKIGHSVATVDWMVRKPFKTRDLTTVTAEEWEAAFDALEPKVEEEPEGMLPFEK